MDTGDALTLRIFATLKEKISGVRPNDALGRGRTTLSLTTKQREFLSSGDASERTQALS